MAERSVGVTDTAPGTGIVEVSTQERGSPDIRTTTTADPGTGGTSLAVTNRSLFPQSGSFKIRVENEVMLVTGGTGTGAGSFTVTRAQDNTTAAAHAIGVTVSQVIAVQRVLPIGPTAISFIGQVSSFRTLGNAAASQNIFSIENQAGSTVIVGVRSLRIEMEATAALLTLMMQFKTSRPTALPSAGTTLGKFSVDTALTSNASVVCRGATASDGGAATAITATAGTIGWTSFGMRVATQVGLISSAEEDILPQLVAEAEGITLRAGEALLVQAINPTAASNAATNHYLVKCAFEEYTVP